MGRSFVELTTALLLLSEATLYLRTAHHQPFGEHQAARGPKLRRVTSKGNTLMLFSRQSEVQPLVQDHFSRPSKLQLSQMETKTLKKRSKLEAQLSMKIEISYLFGSEYRAQSS